MKALNVAEIIKDIHNNAVVHGWWDNKRSLGEVLALIHSELSEALEEYRNNTPALYYKELKPEGLAVELADVIIRIYDYFGYINVDAREAFAAPPRIGVKYDDFGSEITAMHAYVSKAYKEKPVYWLAGLVNHIIGYCCNNGIDITDILIKKHEYNKTRPYKHGGKVI